VELQELGREFLERESRLSAEEAELNRRRSELGAVELKREAVEQRERALAAREEELAAAELHRATESAIDGEATSERSDVPTAARQVDLVTLLFGPEPAYRLVEIEHRSLTVGAPLELDGEDYVVTRIGRAPLPGGYRACAYLERGSPGSSVSGGSS
jgi:hypothetical protein